MENAFTEIRTGRILPGFRSLVLNTEISIGMIRETQGRLAKALGLEWGLRSYKKANPAGGKWGEKNDVSFDAFAAGQGIPCKPIRAWARILQENKIRK
jgi:hypothetical protein